MPATTWRADHLGSFLRSAERSCSFDPLRLVSRGKTMGLGLISTTHSALESTMDGNLMTEDLQWARMRLVAGTAREDRG